MLRFKRFGKVCKMMTSHFRTLSYNCFVCPGTGGLSRTDLAALSDEQILAIPPEAFKQIPPKTFNVSGLVVLRSTQIDKNA